MLHFLKLHIFVYLRTKFQVSSIILTSFRQGVILAPPKHTPKRTPKKSTLIRVYVLVAPVTVVKSFENHDTVKFRN